MVEYRRYLSLAVTRAPSDSEPDFRDRSRELVIEWMREAASTVREIDLRAAVSLVGSATVIGLALMVAFYAPFWAGINTFTGLGQQLRPLYYNSSIVGFISAPLQLLVPASKDAALDKTLRLIFYTIFFVYSYLQTQRLWMLGRQANLRDVITAAAKITFAALLLITFWFQPWYVVWLLPLAALSQEPFVRRQGIILAAGAIMTYAVANFLLVGDTNLVQGVFVQFFEIIIAFGPLLLLRAAPYDRGWTSIFRRYLGLIGKWIHPASGLLGASDGGPGAGRGYTVAAGASGQLVLARRRRWSGDPQTGQQRSPSLCLRPSRTARSLCGGARCPGAHLWRECLCGSASFRHHRLTDGPGHLLDDQ